MYYVEVNKFLNEMKIIQSLLLKLIEAENDIEDHYNDLIKKLDNLKIRDDSTKLTLFLHLLEQISTNHHQKSDFSKYFENILILFKNEIQSFSNKYIFNLFKDNKKILLFLIKSEMLIIDDYVSSQLEENPFFEPELTKTKATEEFEKMRQIGQNENYICELIRNDSVEEFVEYTQRKRIDLAKTVIKPSIFETNHFLVDKNLSLIEYAAFFGSLQIYQYLRFNYVAISDKVIIYAIHGQNSEIIHLFEEDESLSKWDESEREKIYEESIKCYHNDIANYFQDTLFDKSHSYSFSFLKYYNFAFIDLDCVKESLFDLIIYDYQFFFDTFLKVDDSNTLINQIIKTEIGIQFLLFSNKIFNLFTF